MAGGARIRVLVVEDSAVTRDYVVLLLERDPELQVVGTAPDGLIALEQTELLRPDLVLMDVQMPRMNGYEAARAIMDRAPVPIVMMSASFDREGQKLTFQAIEAGALTVVAKPSGPDGPDAAESARRLVQTVKLMSEVKVVRRWAKRKSPPPASPKPVPGPARSARLVALAASTGGPEMLVRILRRLPRDLGAPILLVQHIAPGFAQGLSQWLGEATPFAAKLAESGELVLPGVVYVAPDGQQMGIGADARIRLVDEPGEDGFRPSASYLFASVAVAYGPAAVGVVLTGMGRDGAAGLRKLRDAGGLTLAQDAESCVVAGMPQEAVRVGAVERVLTPDAIAAAIAGAVGGKQ